jgi:hypothetical protein
MRACAYVRRPQGLFRYSHPRWLRLLCMADVCVMGWTIGGATTWAAYSSPTRLASITRMASTTCASRCHEIAIRLCVEIAGRWHGYSKEDMGGVACLISEGDRCHRKILCTKEVNQLAVVPVEQHLRQLNEIMYI